MTQFHLTRQNEYVIKEIARKLPSMPISSWDPNRPTYKPWVNQLIDWLFSIKWPNGDMLIPSQMVLWIRKKFCGLNDHDRNHERRLRRAYLRHGIIGLSHYLASCGAHEQLIKHWLQDIEQTGDDLRAARELEKKIKMKLTR